MANNIHVVNGLAGFDEIVPGAPVAGNWEYLKFVEDTKIKTLDADYAEGVGADPVLATAYQYRASDDMHGRFTSIEIHTGRVRAYRRSI